MTPGDPGHERPGDDSRSLLPVVASAPAFTPIVVDSTGAVGQDTSLAVVNGNPAISYGEYTSGSHRYSRAGKTGGFAWGAPVTVVTGSVGSTSLEVVNGLPAVSYQDVAGGDLLFVRADDPDFGSLRVSPISHDFSFVGLAMSAGQAFTVANNRSTAVEVSATELIGPDAGEFAIVAGAGPVALGAVQGRDITGRFAPSRVAFSSALLRITSDDITNPTVDIPLAGRGSDRRLIQVTLGA